MALPAVSPRSAARARPAFALTRARGSRRLWAGRRGRWAQSLWGGVGGGPPGNRCGPQSSLGAPALGPALESRRDFGVWEGFQRPRVWWGRGPGLHLHRTSSLRPWSLREMDAVPQCLAPGWPETCLPACLPFTWDLCVRRRHLGQEIQRGCQWVRTEVQGKGGFKGWGFLFPS